MKKIKNFIFTYLINTDEKWINTHCFGKRWGIAIVLTYAVWLLFAFYQQEHYLFFPSRNNARTPAPQTADLEIVSFETSDNKKLSGAFLKNTDSDEVILFFHENAGNITNYLGVFSLFEKLGKNALIFDYRDFGLSEGALKKESDFLVDSESAINFLKTKGFTEDKIIFWGKELGAFLATEMSLKHPESVLILENPVSDIRSSMPWFLRYFVPRFFIKYKFDLEEEIAKIKVAPIVLWKEETKIDSSLKSKIPPTSSFLEIPKKTNDLGTFMQELGKLIPNESLESSGLSDKK